MTTHSLDRDGVRIPDATKVVIPAAGHEANIDQPAAFDEAVVSFLRSLPEEHPRP